ncbi:MAG: PRC-barrel domain-containing protein [Candidatus Peregrinibacteria bacterium]
MQLRFSTCLGIPVMEEQTNEPIGVLSGIVLHPDTGKVEGFFVRTGGLFSSFSLFLPSSDIARFGVRVSIRSRDSLAPPGEFLRIQPLLADRRTVLGQRIETKAGRTVGRCVDVQFDSVVMQLTWLFPRRFLRWGDPIPATDILRVTPQAIIVRGPRAEDIVEEISTEEQQQLLSVLPEVEG